jgi:hypothetical protein
VNIDDALIDYRGELVVATARWQRASRRRRRLVLASSALAAALVVAGAAVAATGWLVGAPAPPSVKADFGSYAPQLGFNPTPGESVLVASDGRYRLYATTNDEGTYCVFVSAPWKRPGPNGEGGDCITPQTAAERFWAGLGGGASGPDGQVRYIIDGRTTEPNAVSVRFSAPDGQTVTAPIGTSGFFITHAEVDQCTPWTPKFVFLDGSGNALGETSWPVGVACVTPTTSQGG